MTFANHPRTAAQRTEPRPSGSGCRRNVLALAVLLACPLLAAETSPTDFVWSVAEALSNGDTAAFRESFDPSMPGLKAFERNAAALMAQAGVESRIEFGPISGVGGERLLDLDWTLDITQREGIAGLTHRTAKVHCRLLDRGGHWRIASFEPADFFSPAPDMAAMWDMFHDLASAMNNGDVGQFLSFFDPAFAAKIHLREAVAPLQAFSDMQGRPVSGVELQPSLELVTNEGDDRLRTVAIDWAIDLASVDSSDTGPPAPGVVNVRKSNRVTFRVAKIGKKWRTESFEPADFFEMTPR